MDRTIDYKKLRNFREDKGLKQKQMADKLNITPSAYSRIEKGERGLRVEQLKVIAEVLGKKYDAFFKEGKENNSPQGMKTEIELLETILCMISREAEIELFTQFYKYSSNYPEYPLVFEEYLTDPHCNPQMAISQIKDDIEEYKKEASYPFLYDELYGDKGIKHFMNRSDTWLKHFVTQKENYTIIYEALMSPHYQKEEDLFSAFKDMLRENPIVHILFQYGLFETSWFTNYWAKYLEEMKPSISGAAANAALIQNVDSSKPSEMDGLTTAESRKNRERIREKLKNIFSRN